MHKTLNYNCAYDKPYLYFVLGKEVLCFKTVLKRGVVGS